MIDVRIIDPDHTVVKLSSDRSSRLAPFRRSLRLSEWSPFTEPSLAQRVDEGW
jgi:hypothetical protein